MLAWLHRDDLLAVARRRVVCREDAEDVVHEAMLRAVEFEGLDESRIAPWMNRVVVNLCTDAGRDRARAAKRRRYSVMMDMDAASPEDVVIERALAALACAKLSGLPGAQREAMLLRAQGLAVEEVAKQLGVGYKAAESLLSRGRAALRAGFVAGTAYVFAAARTLKRDGVAMGGIAAAALTVVALAPSPGPSAANPNVGSPAAGHLAVADEKRPMIFRDGSARTTFATSAARTAPVVAHEVREVKVAPSKPARYVLKPLTPTGLGVSAGGVTAQEHERSWQEELLECVRSGGMVTAERIGCPPPGETSEQEAKDEPLSP